MTTEEELEAENTDLRYEIQGLHERIKGDPQAGLFFSDRKVVRQRAALDILNRKLTTLHFQLREIERLGRGLSREEYLAARGAVSNDAHRERIEERV
jgi:hypothetical protein